MVLVTELRSGCPNRKSGQGPHPSQGVTSVLRQRNLAARKACSSHEATVFNKMKF